MIRDSLICHHLIVSLLLYSIGRYLQQTFWFFILFQGGNNFFFLLSICLACMIIWLSITPTSRDVKTLQKFNLDKYIWFYCPITTCKHFWQGDKFFTTADVLNGSILLYTTNCNILLAKCHKKRSWKAVWWHEVCNAASERIEMFHSQHFNLDFHTLSKSSSHHFLPWKKTLF